METRGMNMRILFMILPAFIGWSARAGADEKADRLIERARQVAQAAKSLEVSGEVISTNGSSAPVIVKLHAVLLRPIYYRIAKTYPPMAGKTLIATDICDGKAVYFV